MRLSVHALGLYVLDLKEHITNRKGRTLSLPNTCHTFGPRGHMVSLLQKDFLLGISSLNQSILTQSGSDVLIAAFFANAILLMLLGVTFS